jgi:coatomer subunit beta
LINAIHHCAIHFSDVTESVLQVLMDFITDTSNSSAVDVISFVREVMEKSSHLRSAVMERLFDNFSDIKSGRIFRGAIWIIGEYALDPKGTLFCSR